MFRELGDRVHEGLMINSIGVTLTRLQRYDEARTALETAASHNRETGERLLEAHSLSSLGEVYRAQGRLAESQDSFERSLAIRREIGDRRGEGWVLLQLSRVLCSRGDAVAARSFAAEAAQIATECQDGKLLAESTNTNQIDAPTTLEE
ncbi:MAG: tetratricopeptide repeat protein [Gemmatimonadaceae bacterium]